MQQLNQLSSTVAKCTEANVKSSQNISEEVGLEISTLIDSAQLVSMRDSTQQQLEGLKTMVQTIQSEFATWASDSSDTQTNFVNKLIAAITVSVGFSIAHADGIQGYTRVTSR